MGILGNKLGKKRILSMILLLIVSHIFIFTACNDAQKGLFGLGLKVDLEDPSITIGKYATGKDIKSGDYVKGVITLTGTVADDILVTQVEISFDNGKNYIKANLNEKKGTWSYTIDTSAHTDGQRDIKVKVTDKVKKQTITSAYLIFDNTAPLTIVNSAPGLTAPATNQTIIIRGVCSDPYPIRSVTASIEKGIATINSIKGTYSWSINFTATASATYKIKIIATDYAGNSSSKLFYYPNLKVDNQNKELSAEQAYAVYNGKAVAEIALTKEKMRLKEFSELSLAIDLSLDLPKITITSPKDGDAQTTGSSIIGRVIDDDGVDLTSVKIAFDLTPEQMFNESFYNWDNTNPKNTRTNNNGIVYFQHNIPTTLATGAQHTLFVMAKDINGLLAVAPNPEKITFLFDKGAPEIAITNHQSGDVLKNHQVLFKGKVEDDNSVIKIEYSLNNGNSWHLINPASYTSGSTGEKIIEWTQTIDLQTEGSHNIKFKATDNTNGYSIFNLYLEVDEQPPTHAFIFPVLGVSVNGIVDLRGAFTDNNRIKNAFIMIGKESAPGNDWKPLTNPTNWKFTMNSQLYDNDNYATRISALGDPGSGVWSIIIRTKASDLAGNEFTTDNSYTLTIDNDLDRPSVIIISPQDNKSIGGAIRVTGTAFDDEAIYKVFMQIDANGDGDYLDQFDLDGDSLFTSNFEKESTWYEISGKELWYMDLNKHGEFYHTEAGHNGTINLRVKAQDTKNAGVDNGDVFGDFTPKDTTQKKGFTIRFDDTLPFVNGISPNSGTYIKGLQPFTASFFDKQSATPTAEEGIQSMAISLDNGSTYQALNVGSTSDYTLTAVTNPNFDQFNLSYNINTLAPDIISKIINNILYVRLKVIDKAGYQYNETVPLKVDNTTPTGQFTITSVNANDVTGDNFSMQGRGADTVSSIHKVEVYLTDKAQTTLYKPNDFTTTSTTIEKVNFNDGNNLVTYPTSNPNMIVTINDFNENGTDGAGNEAADGYDEGISLNGAFYTWYFKFKTLASHFEDGEYLAHAVIYDDANNALYCNQNIFIKNNKPTLGVAIALDLNGTKAIIPAIDYIANYDSANILKSYNGYLELRLAGTGANGGLTFSVKKNGTSDELANFPVDANHKHAQIITDYTGRNYPDDTDSPITYTSFTCSVTDSKNITATQEVKVRLKNYEAIKPTTKILKMYDRKEGAKYLYVQNINGADKWGYLYKDPGTGLTSFLPWALNGNTEISGHLEPPAENIPSVYTNYNGWDPKASGSIYIRGHVHDDQRIKTLSVIVDGVTTQIATSVSQGTNFMEPSIPGLITDPDYPETLTIQTGHDYYFIYKWDTSKISSMTKLNTSFEFSSSDYCITNTGANNNQIADSNQATSVNDADYNKTTVDVMPYIHTITRGNNKTTNRSKQGRYPVMQGENGIVIKGWNLGKTSTPPTKAIELGNTSWNHASHHNLTGDTTWNNNDGTQMTMKMSANGNGLLWMQIGSIPLLNNNNNNALLQNKELDNTGSTLNNSMWNDDRYFRVWRTGDTFENSNSANHLSMAIRPLIGGLTPDDGQLVASFVKYGDSSLNWSYPKSDGDSTTRLFSTFDPPEYSDIQIDSNGNINIAFISNMISGTNWQENASGAVCAYSNNGPNNTPKNQSTTNLPSFNNLHCWASERLLYDEMLWQFNRPQIVRNGNNAHVSYFDSFTQTIKYCLFESGNSLDLKPWVVIDGPTDTGIGDSDDTVIGNGAVSTFASGLSASTGVSADSSIFLDEDGNPIIIYYDTISKTLRLARTNQNKPNLANEWSIQQVLSPSDSNKNFTGSDNAAICDATGKVHVAAFNVSNGDLIYSQALDNGDSSPRSDYNFTTSIKVDVVGAVGSGIDISLKGANPYISYIDNSQSGTLNAVKMAFFDGTIWRYETLPLEFSSVNDHTEIECSINSNKNWDVAIGYKSSNNSRFELIYLLKDL